MRHVRSFWGGKLPSAAGRTTEFVAPETSRKVSDIVDRLEELAAREDCGSRPVFMEARQLKSDLVACGMVPPLRALRQRGALAYNQIRDQRSATMEAEKAEASENARTKRRIVTAIDAAASSDDPARFRRAVRDICLLYRNTKSAGAENAALNEQFRTALSAFRAVVNGRKPSSGSALG